MHELFYSVTLKYTTTHNMVVVDFKVLAKSDASAQAFAVTPLLPPEEGWGEGIKKGVSSDYRPCYHFKFTHYPTLKSVDPEQTPVLEVDELWFFVFSTVIKVWIQVALNRETREVVAYACGDRSEGTCRILWNRIPPAYKKATVFSDYRKAYQAVTPDEQHGPVGKETGETAHVERWHNTLRQHLARFVRKTLS